MEPAPAPAELVVFADDWGRHPSSCQHLVRHLLPRRRAVWVNTVGTRRVNLSLADMRRAAGRLREWFAPAPGDAAGPRGGPANLSVVAPKMWPGFRRRWQRRLNAAAISRAVARALAGAGQGPEAPAPVVVTTLPITADLVGRIPARRWVYYCVDDFSVWPGIDGDVMQAMERELLAKVDGVLVVSDALMDRVRGLGRDAELLTHGIDLEHWAFEATQSLQTDSAPTARREVEPPAWGRGLARPILLFWGLIDRRLDVTWCRELVQGGVGTLVLVGPQQQPDEALRALARPSPGAVVLAGPADYRDLPALAAWADVLVMPYADLPVTRAMQPLKFKEYLAAGWPGRGKPVVARDLPATRAWADAADLVSEPSRFVQVVRQRAGSGLPPEQRAARRRLEAETWAAKAARFEAAIFEP